MIALGPKTFSSAEVYDVPPWIAREVKPEPRVFWVQVYCRYDDGSSKRIRQRRRNCTRTEAEQWAKDQEVKLRAHQTAPVTVRLPAPKVPAADRRSYLATGELVTDWYGRYHDAVAEGRAGRRGRGKPQASVGRRRGIYRKWIQQVIGHLPMQAVTADHVRDVVEQLDEQIRIRNEFWAGGVERVKGQQKPGLSAKSAQYVWSEVTSGFREAVSSKLKELRILTVDPTRDVRPPDTGPTRIQAALYPDEVVKLLSCKDIPLWRRRLYAFAIYTGMRRSEIDRVRKGDVDLEHEVITVRGSKSNAATRQVPIEPAFLPLVKLLMQEVGDEEPLVNVPRADGKGGTSDLMRTDLEAAKLTRADLFRDDERHMPFTFHGCRHTALTHWAVAGRPQHWLLAVAGHVSPDMTRRYLDLAAIVRTKFGTPHPKLPAGILARGKTGLLRVA